MATPQNARAPRRQPSLPRIEYDDSSDASSVQSYSHEPPLPAYSAADRVGYQERPAQFYETRCHQLQTQLVELRELFAAKDEIILHLRKNQADQQTRINLMEKQSEHWTTSMMKLDYASLVYSLAIMILLISGYFFLYVSTKKFPLPMSINLPNAYWI